MNKLKFTLIFFLAFIIAKAQPTLVKDIYPGTDAGNPTGLIRYNGKIYFSAVTPDSVDIQTELWVSDGTANGTQMVYDLPSSAGGSTNPYGFVVANNKLFYIGDAVGGTQVWMSDGTSSGTKIVVTASYPDIFDGTDNNLVVMGNSIYLRAIETSNFTSAIYKTDGTVPGTKRLGTSKSATGTINHAAVLNNNLIMFIGINDAYGITKTDGTAGGTSEIMKFGNGIYSNMVTFNNAVYFISDTSTLGNLELWKTDGTNAGTVKVKEINPGNKGIIDFLENMTVAGNYLYFMADDGTHGTELWRTDGTTNGTTMVKDITTGIASTNTSGLLFTVNNKVVFTALDGSGSNYTLWASDGTLAGTEGIKQTLSNPIAPNVKNYDMALTELLFADGDKLYATNATSSGTKLVTSCPINNGTMIINEVAYNNGMVMMNVFDSTHGNELYRYNYTPDTASSGIVEMRKHSHSYSVYPNPFNNEISIDGYGTSTLFDVVILDAFGKEVYSKSQLNLHEKIIVNNLLSGMYFYSFKDKNGYQQTGKLIKQ